MRLLFCLFVLAAAAGGYTTAKPSDPVPSRGCIYINGRCYKECEEGTHAYAVGCGAVTREATCAQPQPAPESGIICDYSACYCDAGTVRDTRSNKCVPQDQCPN